jgi:hypothetical protein
MFTLSITNALENQSGGSCRASLLRGGNDNYRHRSSSLWDVSAGMDLAGVELDLLAVKLGVAG